MSSRTLLPGRGGLREDGREGGLGSRVIEWEEEVAAVSASFRKAMDGFNASTAKETTGNYGKKSASHPSLPPSLPPSLSPSFSPLL